MQQKPRRPAAARVSANASTFEIVARLSDARVGVLRSHIRMRLRIADCEQAANLAQYQDCAVQLAAAIDEWHATHSLWLALADQFPFQHAALKGLQLTWRDGDAIGGGIY